MRAGDRTNMIGLIIRVARIAPLMRCAVSQLLHSLDEVFLHLGESSALLDLFLHGLLDVLPIVND